MKPFAGTNSLQIELYFVKTAEMPKAAISRIPSCWWHLIVDSGPSIWIYNPMELTLHYIPIHLSQLNLGMQSEMEVLTLRKWDVWEGMNVKVYDPGWQTIEV